MPLVVTADGGELPLPASSTQMGRAVCRRLGIDAEADKFAVSRVQCEVSVVDDGAGLRVTSLGTNPTPWFPAAEKHARRVLAKGESATLRDGDGLGLVQTEPSPGSMRWRREPNPNPNPTPTPNPPRDEPEPEPAAKRPKTADERTIPDASIDAVPGPSAVPASASASASASAPPSRPVVLILVGPPGAGKSTLCASLPASAWTSVNQDTIGKHGKPGSRDQCVSAVKRALTLGKHVAVDRCHLTEEQRAFFVAVARGRGAEAHAIHLDLPRDVILDRVRRRADHVSVNGEKGVGVAKRMMGQKANAPPTREEGFEMVVTCRDDNDVIAAARRYAAMPRAAAGTNATAIRGAVANENAREAAKAEAATSAPQSRTAATTTSAPRSRTAAPNAFATMMRAAKTAAAKSPEPTSTSEPNPMDPSKPSNSNATGAPWLRALVDVASDPSGKPGVLSHDDEIVVLRDAYPKARAHILVLARDPALRDGPSSLRATHVPLVEKMLAAARSAMARALAETPAPSDGGAPSRAVRFGFHAKPSMPQLHMHAVSQDLRGSSMKTRRHWNTFATDFFRDASEVLDELRARGALAWDEEEAESRVKMERLRCHACGDGPHATMPKLFEHLDKCVAAPPGETIRNIE